ncbi:hypothetical protein REPUB_Repub05bG0143700 [Reevesia pubescens]
MLSSIHDDLMRLWPDLKNARSFQQNKTFWTNEWKKHGMSSDYALDPLAYFNSAIDLRKGLEPELGLVPGTTYSTVTDAAKIIESKVKAKPQIVCKKKVGTMELLLSEVRLCYKRGKPPTEIQDCPIKYPGCDVNKPVKFP